MHSNHLKFSLAILLVLCAGRVVLGQTNPVYQVIDLGPIAEGTVSHGYSVNNAGDAVGQSTADTLRSLVHACRWSQGTVSDLATLGENLHSLATDINHAGQIAGVSYDLGSLHPEAFLWQKGALVPIGPFTPNAINDEGEVCGTQLVQNFDGIWNSLAVVRIGGTLNPLGTLGGDNSFARDISNGNEVVGVSDLSGNELSRAFYWRDGLLQDLGTLGGSNSQAYALNDLRHVVGVADTSNAIPHAFLFKLDIQGNVLERVDLGELGGGYSYALDINSHDAVVGTSAGRAFVWRDGSLSDLNDLIPVAGGWRLDMARGISDSGFIVGSGRHDGVQRAFLLMPNRGDINRDGQINLLDVAPFIALLTEGIYQDEADINQDGQVNLLDVNPFVDLLAG